MNYREKKRRNPEEKKIRKFSAYRKTHPDSELERMNEVFLWEEQAEQQIQGLKEDFAFLPQPGEDLYMTGWIGAAGTMFLADWKREQLCSRFPAAFVNTVKDRELFDNFISKEENCRGMLPDCYIREGASWICPVGEGGLLKALYRFGKETDLGFRIKAKEVPVRQITIEFTEFLLIHPWELMTGKSFLFSADHNAPILDSLEKMQISFRCIGKVTKEKQKLICRGEEESNINRPDPDGILTLLMEEKQQ